MDCNYSLPCPHATAPHRVCATAGCVGVDFTVAVVKDVLLNGITDNEIKREILGDQTPETASINEVIM